WTGAPDAQANTLAAMYRDIATKPRWFDYQRLSQQLFNAGKKSPLGQLVAGGNSFAENEYNFDRYFNALADVTMSEDVALAHKQRVEHMQLNDAQQFARRKGKGLPMNRFIGRNFYR